MDRERHKAIAVELRDSGFEMSWYDLERVVDFFIQDSMLAALPMAKESYAILKERGHYLPSSKVKLSGRSGWFVFNDLDDNLIASDWLNTEDKYGALRNHSSIVFSDQNYNFVYAIPNDEYGDFLIFNVKNQRELREVYSQGGGVYNDCRDSVFVAKGRQFMPEFPENYAIGKYNVARNALQSLSYFHDVLKDEY